MKKYFYSHIIEVDSLYIELDLLNLQKHERDELIELLESTMYHAVLDTILSELTEADKKIFLLHVATERHETIWKFLQDRIKNIEKKIKKVINHLKETMKNDIKKLRSKQ